MVSIIAYLEAWRNQRTAALEAFPIGLDGDVFLGVHFENYGPALARQAEIRLHLQGPSGSKDFEMVACLKQWIPHSDLRAGNRADVVHVPAR